MPTIESWDWAGPANDENKQCVNRRKSAGRLTLVSRAGDKATYTEERHGPHTCTLQECDCHDFQRQKNPDKMIPCMHMYRLAADRGLTTVLAKAQKPDRPKTPKKPRPKGIVTFKAPTVRERLKGRDDLHGVDWSNFPWEVWTDEEQYTRMNAGWAIEVDGELDGSEEGLMGYAIRKYMTTLDSCTCGDFAMRRLPCKHMYALAFHLGHLAVDATEFEDDEEEEEEDEEGFLSGGPSHSTTYHDGFAWALSHSWNAPLSTCRFEDGDKLYSNRDFYDLPWGKAVGKRIEITYPPRSLPDQKIDRSVFLSNWGKLVSFRHIREDGEASTISCQQGNLYMYLASDEEHFLTTSLPPPPMSAKEIDKRIALLEMPKTTDWQFLTALDLTDEKDVLKKETLESLFPAAPAKLHTYNHLTSSLAALPTVSIFVLDLEGDEASIIEALKSRFYRPPVKKDAKPTEFHPRRVGLLR